MCKTLKIICLGALAMLVLAECGTTVPDEMDGIAVTSVTPKVNTAPEVTTTAETTSATEVTTQVTPPEKSPLPDGMLVYSQDFDDFADSKSIKALRWTSGGQDSTAQRWKNTARGRSAVG